MQYCIHMEFTIRGIRKVIAYLYEKYPTRARYRKEASISRVRTTAVPRSQNTAFSSLAKSISSVFVTTVLNLFSQ